jgi:hypothetical protein
VCSLSIERPIRGSSRLAGLGQGFRIDQKDFDIDEQRLTKTESLGARTMLL